MTLKIILLTGLGVSSSMVVRLEMNILVSTTVNWNVGDEVIYEGCRNLLQGVIGRGHNWILYDRNPQNFIDYPRDSRMRSTLSNTPNTLESLRNLPKIDFVLLAGSPEYAGKPTEVLYQFIVEKNIPVLALGIGGDHPLYQFNEIEKKVLGSAYIITRTDTAHHNMVSQGISIREVLPCPGLFLFSEDWYDRQGPTIQILNSPNSPHKVKESSLNTVDLNKYILCFRYEELSYWCGRGANQARLINNIIDFKATLRELGPSQVTTTRLHGGIATLSAGIPTTFIDDGQPRMRDTIDVLNKFLCNTVDRWKFNSNLNKIEQTYIQHIETALRSWRLL